MPGADAYAVLVEDHRPLSGSILWTLQRNYYRARGVEAWAEVPSYVTSNPVIAEAYATAAVRYVQDLERRGLITGGAPVHVVELGAGSGRFGYYAVRAIERLRRALGVATPLRYIMTDFTDINLEHLRRHRALAPLVAAGQLGFGRFDVERNDEIVLDGGAPLALHDQPLIVFANHLFDSIRHDLFVVQGGALHEAYARVRSARGAVEGAGPTATVRELDSLAINFALHPVDRERRYDDPRLTGLLRSYASALTRGMFHIPVGALRCLDTLRTIAGDRLLLLAADRGYDDLEELSERGDPGLAFHGSMSVPVNFHAIGRWVEQAGGDWFQPAPRRALCCEAFLLGDRLGACAELQQALRTHLDGFAPGDYFNVHRQTRGKLASYDLPLMIAYLNLCRWDARMFHGCVGAIHDQLAGADVAARRALLDGLPRVAESFYFLPGVPDTPFEVGSVYQHLLLFEEALAHYGRSESYFGRSARVAYNAGLCLAGLGHRNQALERMHEAADADDTATEARAWIARLESEQHEAALR